MRPVYLAFCCLATVMISSADAQERDQPRERPGEQRVAEFTPANDRERFLFDMIKKLRVEVASLRLELQSRDGDQVRLSTDRGSQREGRMTDRREGDRPREGDRDAHVAANPLMQKAKRIFAAYDKNKDNSVAFEEWLAMREGEMTEERKTRERGFFSEPAGSDDKISLEELYRWMEKRSAGGTREDRSRGGREGESRQRGPRERG